MKKGIYFAAFMLLGACAQQENATSAPNGQPETGAIAGAKVNKNDYQFEEVPGTDWQLATRVDSAGNLLEMGYLDANGQKSGTWTIYHPTKLLPQKLFSYQNGKLNGLYMEFNEGGQTDLVAHYRNDQMHGPWAKYRFSRLLEQATYKDGKLNGEYRLFEVRDGKLKSSAEYKNGVQDGYYRTYNPEGKVTTEYLYRNGKQASGNTVGSN